MAFRVSNLVRAFLIVVMSFVSFKMANAETLVQGPEKVSPGLSLKSSKAFLIPANEGIIARIRLQNGSGNDIVMRACTGSLLAKLVCGIENTAKSALAYLERPSTIELKLGSQVLLSSANYNILVGRHEFEVRVAADANLTLDIKGLPTSSVILSTSKLGNLNLAPIANFDFSPTSGYEPLFVSFNALSSTDPDGQIVDYQWDLGDGGNASGMFVTHLYSTPGQFNVSLTVTDDQGAKHTKTYPLKVIENKPPIAMFNHVVESDLGILLLKVDGSASSDPEGQPITYHWNFGDGATANGSTTEHVYSAPGDYLVVLTVEDSLGKMNSSEKQILVRDEAPPVISILNPTENLEIFGNKSPLSIPVSGVANERMSSVSVNTVSASISEDGKSFFGSIEFPVNGTFSVPVEGSDLAGNVSTSSRVVHVVIDPDSPVITIGDLPERTGGDTVPVAVTIVDQTETSTAVIINSVEVYRTTDKMFNYSFSLGGEGPNFIQVVSSDRAGNTSSSEIKTVVRDTSPPRLTFVSPKQGDVVDGLGIDIHVDSDEPLSAAKVNDIPVELSNSSSIVARRVASSEGSFEIVVSGTDLLGNTTIERITVVSVLRALNISLVGVYPDEASKKFQVKGAVGSVRPGLNVSVSGGWFNGQTVQADERGSFSLLMDVAESYEISVYDSSRDETVQGRVNFGSQQPILLAGTVREVGDLPLVNATVAIQGTQLVTKTDSNGVFQFLRADYSNERVSGDRQLVIDGSTAVIAEGGRARSFSRTSIPVTIGLFQSNVIQTPIYLIPTYLDGAGVLVDAGAGGTVTSPDAPGVVLEIPGGAAIFPNLEPETTISLVEIPALQSTVAVVAEARPKTVVALEPSGTTFSEPVKLTLPNGNEFPAGTEMLIMLMNSKTGLWEVGGAAVVTEDGQRVETKDGQGIRHFSLAYATIAGPTVRAVGSIGRSGADVFDGSVSAKVQLPSFKAMGSAFAPSLSYKSSWAKPVAAVNTFIDFPNKKVELTIPDAHNGGVKPYNYSIETCTFPITGTSRWCNTNDHEFYTNVETITSYSGVTSEIQPEKVVASFKTGRLATAPVEFKNLPHMASISFAVPLTDSSSSNGYVKSGVYPYLAHYDVHFKELIMGTRQTTYWTDFTDAMVTAPTGFSQTNGGGVFSKDIGEHLYVQNYRESASGRGWRISGTQRVLNTAGNKILLEEADGAISAYSTEDMIDTVVDVGSVGGDVNMGVALNNWPTLAVGTPTGEKFLELTVDQSGVTKKELPGKYADQAVEWGYDYYNYPVQGCQVTRTCIRRLYFPGGNVCVEFRDTTDCSNSQRSRCIRTRTAYSVKGSPSQLIYGNGRIIGVDSSRHTLFNMSNSSYEMLMGGWRAPEVFHNFYHTNAQVASVQASSKCGQTIFNPASSEFPCVDLKTGGEVLNGFNACGAAPTAEGRYPVAGNSTQDGLQQLNSPMGVALTPWANIVAVADTGNHVVRWYNYQTKQFGVLVGDGTAMDLGDGRLATEASIKHPQGLVYDASGNLYISTRSGFIRKVDVNGVITTIAGSPWGELSLQSQATDAILNNPQGMVVDRIKNVLYIADRGHNRIEALDLGSGIISTVAGNGSGDGGGDGASAVNASISAPTVLGLDTNRNLLIAESGSQKIRRVTFQNGGGGILTFSPLNRDGSKLQKLSDGLWVRTFRDGREVFFTTKGIQYSERDLVGRRSNYVHDSQDRLTRVILPTNQEVNYEYSGNKLSAILDPAGRRSSFTYNSRGDLTQVRFPDGTKKQFEYDSDGLLLNETAVGGSQISYEYNELSRVTKMSSSAGRTLNVTDTVSENVKETVTGVVDAPKHVREIINKINDSAGGTTYVGVDPNGFVSSVTDARETTRWFVRDVNGNPTFVISGTGNFLQNTFNEYGDVLSTNDQDGRSESFEYDLRGNLVAHIDGNQVITRRVFDPVTGLKVSESNGSDVTTSYEYNDFGQVTEVKSGPAAVVMSTFEYDTRGNLVKETDLGGISKEYVYDLAGNITTTIRNIESGATEITSSTFDLHNRRLSVLSPKGALTSYSYNSYGDLIKVTDPTEREISFSYDQERRLISKTDQLAREWHFTYDSKGNVATETDPKGQVKRHQYDANGNLIRVDYPDQTLTFGYDGENRLSYAANNDSNIEIYRDAQGRVTYERVDGFGQNAMLPWAPFHSAYDGGGNLVGLAAEGFAQWNMGYDTANRLVQVGYNGADYYGFAYDQIGRLASLSRSSGDSVYSYSGSNLSAINHMKDGVTQSFVEYTYDQRSLLKSKRDPAGLMQYSNDADGALTSATSEDYSESFSYDSLGNRVSDGNGSYVYDSARQRLTEDYQYTYLYDANGNLIRKTPKDSSKTAFVLGYSSANQLTLIQELNGIFGQVIKETRYSYDALGRRLRKSVEDKQFPDDSQKTFTRMYANYNGELRIEFDGLGRSLAVYSYSGASADDVLSIDVTEAGVENGLAQVAGIYHLRKDAIGSITEVVDSAGASVQRINYSSFGKVRSIKSHDGSDVTLAPVFRLTKLFAGRDFDTESGMYYNRARYYDPQIGRFIQTDPHPGSMSSPLTLINSYLYVGNMPNTFTDPSGQFAFLLPFLPAIIKIATPFLIGFAVNFVMSLVSEDSLGDAVINGLIGGASNVLAPGLGSFFAKGLGKVGAYLAANIIISTVGSGVGAIAMGKELGVSLLVGAVNGFLGGVATLSTASQIYKATLSKTASEILSEPFGYWGGMILNSGADKVHSSPNTNSNSIPLPAH